MQVQNHLNFLPLMMLQAVPDGDVISARADCGHWQMCFTIEVVVFYIMFFLSIINIHRYPFLFSLLFPSSLFDFI